jgi:chromosome segregation ATPase
VTVRPTDDYSLDTLDTLASEHVEISAPREPRRSRRLVDLVRRQSAPALDATAAPGSSAERPAEVDLDSDLGTLDEAELTDLLQRVRAARVDMASERDDLTEQRAGVERELDRARGALAAAQAQFEVQATEASTELIMARRRTVAAAEMRATDAQRELDQAKRDVMTLEAKLGEETNATLESKAALDVAAESERVTRERAEAHEIDASLLVEARMQRLRAEGDFARHQAAQSDARIEIAEAGTVVSRRQDALTAAMLVLERSRESLNEAVGQTATLPLDHTALDTARNLVDRLTSDLDMANQRLEASTTELLSRCVETPFHGDLIRRLAPPPPAPPAVA